MYVLEYVVRHTMYVLEYVVRHTLYVLEYVNVCFVIKPPWCLHKCQSCAQVGTINIICLQNSIFAKRFDLADYRSANLKRQNNIDFMFDAYNPANFITNHLHFKE